MTDRKRKALVSLLEDPDEKIYLVIKQVIKAERERIEPMLQEALKESLRGSKYFERIASILHEIHIDRVKRNLKDWKMSSEKDLLKALVTLSNLQQPSLNLEQIESAIETIKRDVWLELNDYQTAFEQVKIFNYVFFEVHRFEVLPSAQVALKHLNVAHVLETKQGNPLIIGLLYSIIAHRLQLPIYGIDFPGVFILAWMDEKQVAIEVEMLNEYGVLFYINPAGKGIIFDDQQIHAFLKEIEVEPNRRYFEPTSNTGLIHRYLKACEDSCKFQGDLTILEDLLEIKSEI